MLKDVLVLDLADEQGSFCSKLLADLGATVIKVEEAGGERFKFQNPIYYFYNNTNKLRIPVDFRNQGETLSRLVKSSDVLVETDSRVGLESLGLGRQRRLCHRGDLPAGSGGNHSLKT